MTLRRQTRFVIFCDHEFCGDFIASSDPSELQNLRREWEWIAVGDHPHEHYCPDHAGEHNFRQEIALRERERG